MNIPEWKEIELGEVLSHRKDSIIIEDDKKYRRVKVQLHAKGIVPRDEVFGRDIKTKKQFPIKANDLLVAEIDAKIGGYGVVSKSLAGAIVSSHYFLYEVDTSQIDLRYLELWLRTPTPLDQLKRYVKGALNYAAVRPYHFPKLKINLLASLEEQRRIVSRVDAKLGIVDKIKLVSVDSERGINALLRSAYHEITADVKWKPFAEVASLHRRKVTVEPDQSYEELGVRSFGKGTFHKPALTGIELGSKRIFHMEPDDLVFNIVFAWEGAVAVVKPEDAGRVGSHRFLTYVPDPQQATAKFLAFHFLTYKGLEDLGKASPGAAGRNKTLGVKALENIKVPVPSVERQQWFDKLVERRDEMMRIKREAALELAAVEPALLQRAFSFAAHQVA
jgi:type I restriction enzyme S subunit